MANAAMMGWDADAKVWRKVLVNSAGKLIIDPSEIFENVPTLNEHGKAPDSDWAYDHKTAAQAHADYMLNTGDDVTGSYTFDTDSLSVDAVNHRIGIGTATPGYALDVKSGGTFALNLKANSDTLRPGIRMEALRPTSSGLAFTLFDLFIGNSPTITHAAQIGFLGVVAASPAASVPYYLYMGATTATSFDNAVLKIDATDRIGIGMIGWNRPLSKLQVGDVTSGTGEPNGHGCIAIQSADTAATDAGGLEFKSAAGGNGVGAKIWTSTNGYLYFSSRYGSATWGNRMVINLDTGSVGIGTTTPTSKLQVVGILEYADNAEAVTAGLTAGAFYRTGDILKVVH